jgi:glutamate-1-semialdehyde 2,1-aminomutase
MEKKMGWKILTGETDIEKEYLRRTRKSKGLDQIACRYLPGGSTRSATDSLPYPVYMEKGEQCYLIDVDGNKYIDFMNNFTVLILGHAHPKVCQAISEQLKRGTVLGAPSESQYELAKLICRRVNSVEKVRFCNSGTEAVMYAIRTARAVTGKNKVLKMEGGYHGTTGQMEISVSPNLALAGSPEKPVSLPDTKGIPLGVLQDTIVAPFNNIEATDRIINENRKQIAAVIVEPMLGAAGMIPAEEKFLKYLREVTSQNKIILIFDEIISFRLSRGGAQEIYRTTPDLTTFGKIIGGGLPIGAFGGREEIMDIFSPKRKNPMPHSGTFNGNPLTMTAGIETIREIDGSLISHINRLGDILRKGIKDIFEKKDIRGQVTGMGSLMNIHFSPQEVVDFRTARAGSSSSLLIRDLLNLSLKNYGIYTPRRVMLSISSPMTMRDVKKAMTAFEESLDQLRPIVENHFPEFLM